MGIQNAIINNTIGIQKIIAWNLWIKRKKLASTSRRIYEIEHPEEGKSFRERFRVRPDSLANLKNQRNELETDERILKSISNIKFNDPDQTESMKEELYNNYKYAAKSRNKIRGDFYKLEKSKQKTQEIIEKESDALNNLMRFSKHTPENMIATKEQKEKIAGLALKQCHHTRLMVDAGNNYEFAQKIISNAGTDPDKILSLKRNMSELNAAIKKQQGLQTRFENFEKYSLDKWFVLNKRTEHTNIPDILARPPTDKRSSDSDILDYVQAERCAQDLEKDYDFSRKLLERYTKTGETGQLKKQFRNLDTASGKRYQYRRMLVDAENNQFNHHKKFMALQGKIKSKERTHSSLRTKEQNEDLAEDYKEQQALTQREDVLKRRIDDAQQLHDFANQLIGDASKNADASNLPTLLTKLGNAADKQEEYRGKLDSLEKELLEEKNKTPKDAAAQRQKEFNIKRLEHRKENAANDHAFTKAFIEKAKKVGNPSALADQFKQIEIEIAKRNKLTSKLEKEQKKQFDKKNNILKAKAEISKLETKYKSENAALGLMPVTDPKYIDKQSAVSKAENALHRQEWKVKKLERRETQNLERDKKRMENSENNEEAFKKILERMLNPDAKPGEIAAAKQDFVDLEQKIKNEKAEEEALAPKDRRSERKTYRKNLEAAEAKRLTLNEKQNSHNIALLKEGRTDKLAKKEARLQAESEQITREEKDTTRIYEFSSQLLKDSINDKTLAKAGQLKNQFSELKTADQLQRESRKEIAAVDKKLNSVPEKLEKEQLQRQKDDLIYGHAEMGKLIQAAVDARDPTGLKKQCEDLREGVGGKRRYQIRSFFGQAINRKALEESQGKYLENERNFKKSEEEKNIAEKTQKEDPSGYKKAFENYENNQLLQTQSERRRDDARKDYKLGDDLIKATVADGPDKPQRLALLKEKFSALQEAIKERNKFTERLEKVEKAAKKSERKDAKNISNAEKKKNSLEKDLEKVKIKLDAEQKNLEAEKTKLEEEKKVLSDLKNENPPSPDAIDKQILAVDKQHRVVDKQHRVVDKLATKEDELQESTANQREIFNGLNKKAKENNAAHGQLIAEAKALHAGANAAVEETKNEMTVATKNNKVITAIKNTIMKKEMKKFTKLHAAATTADAQEETRKDTQKTEQTKEMEEAARIHAGARKEKAEKRTTAAGLRKDAANNRKFAAKQRKAEEVAARKEAIKERKDLKAAAKKEVAKERKEEAAEALAIPAMPSPVAAVAMTPATPSGGTFKIEYDFTSNNPGSEPQQELEKILQEIRYDYPASYTLGEDNTIRIPDGKEGKEGKSIGKFTFNENGMTVVSEKGNLPADNKALIEIAAIYAAEKKSHPDAIPTVTLDADVKLFRAKEIRNVFAQKKQAKVLAMASAPVLPVPAPVVAPTPAAVPPPNLKPIKPQRDPAVLPANSIRVAVHTSNIARNQAIEKMENLTGCKLVEQKDSPNREGDRIFSLMDASTNKPKGTFTFSKDENETNKMTATFKPPIEEKYIKATAIFAAEDQPNDRNKENIQINYNFTAGPGVNQTLIDSVAGTFNKQYEDMQSQKRMKMEGVAIANENEKISMEKPKSAPQQQQTVPESGAGIKKST